MAEWWGNNLVMGSSLIQNQVGFQYWAWSGYNNISRGDSKGEFNVIICFGRMSNKRGSSSWTRKEGTFSCLAARKMLFDDYLHLLYDYQERKNWIVCNHWKGVGVNNCSVSVECSEINRSQWKTQYDHLFSYRSQWLYSVNRIVLSRSKYNWTQFTSLAINQFYKNMEHLIEYKVLKPGI